MDEAWTALWLMTRASHQWNGFHAAHGCTAAIEWSPRPYPPTVNDAGAAALVARVGARLAPTQLLPEPTMAAEDFSFYARASNTSAPH